MIKVNKEISEVWYQVDQTIYIKSSAAVMAYVRMRIDFEYAWRGIVETIMEEILD